MPIESAFDDLRLAIRALRRQPWSTLAIAGTLALGIGATTAIYALFNFVLFRPIPGVPTEHGLFTAIYRPPGRSATAYGAIAALPAMRAATTASVELLGAGDPATVAISAPGDQPTFEAGEFVTAQYFAALGVQPRLGRLLTDDEADNSSDSIVVISERLWRLKLDGAADASGKTLTINGHPFVVVGVISQFRGWSGTRVGSTDWWAPMSAMKMLTGYRPSTTGDFIGRVRAGSSLPAIQEQLQVAYLQAVASLDPSYSAYIPFLSAGLGGRNAMVARTNGMRLYWLLISAAALLLLLSCANAATMLLARVNQRERDTAVRMAIGAGRWRVLRQFLIEAIGIAGIAAVVGLMIASGITRAFRGMQLLSYLPALDTIELDTRVLAFCLGIAIATVLAFGLVPAVIASSADVRSVLGRTARNIVGHHRLRNGLVIGQMALSLLLIAGAVVLNRSLLNLLTTDLGMDLRGVYKLTLKPDNLGYDSARSRETVHKAVGALRAGGFGDVATSSPEPLLNGAEHVTIKMDDGTTIERGVFVSSVSAGYFELFGMRFVRGRGFTDAEAREPISAPLMPVVLSESMSRRLFGNGADVGRTFELTRVSGMPGNAIVVGIVGDTRSSAVRREPREAIYHMRPSGLRYTQILVRPNGPVGPALDRIRAVIQKVDPGLPITTLRPLEDDVREDLSQDRVVAKLSGLVAILAGLIGAAGIFSVVSQLVAERTRDFGIRAALGASRSGILRHVVSGALRQCAAGVAIGLVLYFWVSRYVADRLFGVDRLDPLTLAVSISVLVGLVVLAAAWPAHRAAATDPAKALRAE